ncbi:MAG TPA: hypothetical protein O0Y08_03970 [Methanocorpusculum sp.]|nr:hypothetical protein [Candidatus Methanocorpusculum equi]MCQ2357385.1 hypothetical protein [Methanocorpusculum sp.]HJJ44752.1 hypothetical protein [Methanocorpusculum sp.]HJJ60001.1 hypothetical protein [Methanocorpusculum sp.]
MVDMNGLIYLAQLSLLEKFFEEYREVFTSDFVQDREMEYPSPRIAVNSGCRLWY